MAPPLQHLTLLVSQIIPSFRIKYGMENVLQVGAAPSVCVSRKRAHAALKYYYCNNLLSNKHPDEFISTPAIMYLARHCTHPPRAEKEKCLYTLISHQTACLCLRASRSEKQCVCSTSVQASELQTFNFISHNLVTRCY